MGLELIRINPDGERVQFRPDAAASFRRMEAQQGRQLDVNRTVVTWDEQNDLYQKRLRGEYPYSVAHPDESNHVYRSDTDGGSAWDTDERGAWLDDNGWIADIEGEPWHRHYIPGRDRRRNDPAPTNTTNTQKEYPDMFYAIIKPKGSWYLIVPQGNAKPRAVILGANAIKGGDLPVIEFEWEGSINGLKGAVDGILD
uniref:hypothetical protein n=1 Tax=Microbacterium proteolyticum TaxID=1572644 RepID=UPI002416199F|nr:hypothetical protein [Microbacterium proteolyticum]